MTDGDIILAAVVDKLRGISGLVTLMNGDGNISAHTDESSAADYMMEFDGMAVPGILAVYQGAEPVGFGSAQCWEHRISLMIKPPQGIGPVFKAMMDGAPAGQSMRFIDVCMTDAVDPMEPPRLVRQQMDVGGAAFAWWEVQLGLREKNNYA